MHSRHREQGRSVVLNCKHIGPREAEELYRAGGGDGRSYSSHKDI